MLKLLLPLTVCFCGGRGESGTAEPHTATHTQIGQGKRVRSRLLFFSPQTLDLISVSLLHPPQQCCLSWPGCAWLWNLCFRLIKAWGWRGEGGVGGVERGREAERCTASLGTEPHPWVPKSRRCRPAAAVLRGASCGGSAGSSAWALGVCLRVVYLENQLQVAKPTLFPSERNGSPPESITPCLPVCVDIKKKKPNQKKLNQQTHPHRFQSELRILQYIFFFFGRDELRAVSLFLC